MKKLISLILCLLLCFTFIVSCEKEEKSSSSSSEESSTSEVPSVQPPKFPSMIENAYTTYRLEKLSNSFEREHLRTTSDFFVYKNWLFKDFNSYIEFFNTYATDRWSEGSFLPEQITADTFKDYVILAVVFQHDSSIKELKYGCLYNYAIRNSTSPRDEYLLVAEKTSVLSSVTPDGLPPYEIDLVLIPRSDITGNDINAVDVLMYSNSYEPFSSDTSSFVICIKAERD